MRKRKIAEAGEWIYVPWKTGVVDVCCDCKLAHDSMFKIKNGKLYWQSFRNKKATEEGRLKKQNCWFEIRPAKKEKRVKKNPPN